MVVLEHPDESESDSDDEEAVVSPIETDGEYETDEEFGEELAIPDFDDEDDGAW